MSRRRSPDPDSRPGASRRPKTPLNRGSLLGQSDRGTDRHRRSRKTCMTRAGRVSSWARSSFDRHGLAVQTEAVFSRMRRIHGSRNAPPARPYPPKETNDMSKLSFSLNIQACEGALHFAGWRVRMIRSTRAPAVTYGPEGRPLVLPNSAGVDDLRAAVDTRGTYRLHFVDRESKRAPRKHESREGRRDARRRAKTPRNRASLSGQARDR